MQSRGTRRLLLGSVLIGLIGLCAAGLASAQFGFRSTARVNQYTYRVVAEYPHDPNSFTQGLLIHNGDLLEGTGQYGESRLMRVDLKTGKPLQQVDLHRQYFGEGIAVAEGELFQLTWQNRVGLVYDPKTFELKRTVRYLGEGWGLTYDGESLIMSDGSSTLRFFDPATFTLKRRLNVQQGNRAIKNLNELEYVEGEIWANIWYESSIARIDPKTGQVTGWIQLEGLKPRSVRFNREAVYNGIAYDAKTKQVYVTGKNWPTLYEIEVLPAK